MKVKSELLQMETVGCEVIFLLDERKNIYRFKIGNICLLNRRSENMNDWKD